MNLLEQRINTIIFIIGINRSKLANVRIQKFDRKKLVETSEEIPLKCHQKF